MTSGIDNNEWDRLSPLLDEALELAPAAREAWLAVLARDNPELAAVVAELLAEKTAVDNRHFLEDSPAAALGHATLAGQRVSAYEIDRLIGQGGMGAVWLAHRCDGRYEGNVAIKLLNASLIGGPAEQRFIREGSVLAALQHPNIAHLIDAGVSAGGQPYLILEHVEGCSVTDYCDKYRLGIRARLRVFLKVLEAVAYAHRYLVVHRDLKPSNVLVTDDGVVKLLDFGIAMLVEPAADELARRECTREIGTALTPEFAAPEQLLGEAVTTATDIFALGRVLYVLLGGSQDARTRGRSAGEPGRETAGRALPLLSQVVANAGMKRLLRGDLDNIVTKALKSEPQERYATVEAFADDLKRHLANEPVSARPDSLGYRVGKFVQRHRGGVLGGTVSALALVALTVFALLQMLEAQRQRDEAETQRQRAQGFSTAITSLLSQAGPGGRALAPGELLERAVVQVEATYAEEPAFLVHMLILISGRYFDLQDTNREYATLVKAESAARASGDPVLIFRVQCNTVETELAAGRKPEAERRLAEALALQPVLGDAPELDRVACLRAQAQMARADGDLSVSLEHLAEARRVLETSGRTDGNVYGGILSMLAAYHGEAGNSLAAHDYSVLLVDVDKRLGRQKSVPGLIARVSLATSFLRLGQVRRASALHREAAIDRSPSGPARMLYAEVLARLGRYDEAIALAREAVGEIDRGGHLDYRIRARLILAQAHFLGSRLSDAERALEDATGLMQADDARHRRWLIDARRLHGDILLAAGRLDEAEAEISLALRQQRDSGPDDRRTAAILLSRARVAIAGGDAIAAAGAARAAAELYERDTIDPEQSADVGEALLVLAQAESALGNRDAAQATLDRAGRSLTNALGPDHHLTRLGSDQRN